MLPVLVFKMDFKKLASDAGTLFSRAKQYTEEMLGQAEATEYDAHLDNLIQKADRTKLWTEKILSQTETVLQPNPSIRLEEYFYEKVQGKRPILQVDEGLLGQFMVQAGNQFDAGTPYGRQLIRCGELEQKLGEARQDFIAAASRDFLRPLRTFLDGDMKTVQKERRTLDTKRLDLDAAKSRLRRAKSLQSRESAENDVRIAQSDFERQCEVTRLLLQGLGSAQVQHLRCLQDFIAAHTAYHAQCHQLMSDLHTQLATDGVTDDDTGTAGPAADTVEVATQPASSTANSTSVPSSYQYDASGMTELSLLTEEDAQVFDQ